MADNTNYIGVAMGLDVTDLKAGLSEANKQIQLANSEFKSASSGMDDWTKSAEGITAKVKQLDTVLKAQKSKLAGLTAEYEKVAKEQGEGSEAARKLKVQINNQQAVVNKTQKEFDNFADVLKQAEAGTLDLEKATVGANGKLKELGDGAKEAGDGFTVMKGVMANLVSSGITALVGGIKNVVTSFFGLAESTREVRENFNKLETSFESAGHSAETAKNTYKDLYGVIGDEGAATEAAQQIVKMSKTEKDLAANTRILTGVMAEYGSTIPTEGLAEGMAATAAMGSVQGVLADALEWQGVNLDEYNEKLETMSSEEERAAYIQKTLTDLYGEAADAYSEKNKSIIEAREADAAYTQALAEMGAVVEPIMTTLKMLGVELLGVMQPFIQIIGEGLTGVLNGTAGAADTLAQGLSGLLSTLFEKVLSALPTVIETVVSLISTLLPQIISTLAGFLPTLIQTLASQLPVILQTIISGFSQILTSVGAMLPELIPIIIDAVLMIVETLLDNIDQLIDAGISLILGLADGLIKALPQLIAKIPVIIEKLLGAITRNLPKIIASGFELLLSLREGIMDAVPDLIRQIPEIIKSIVKALVEGIPDLLKAGKDMLEGLFESFLDPDVIWERVTALGDSIVDAAKSFFGISSPSKLMRDEIGEYLGEGVGVGLLDSMPKIKKNLAKFGNYITDNLGGIKSGLSLGVAGVGAYAGAGAGGRVVHIDARQTLNYNGNLSLKEVKQREREHLTAVKIKMKAEGWA